MKRLIYILSILFISAIYTGCDKDFDVVNTDLNSPVTVPSVNLLGDIARMTTNTLYYSFVGGDMGSCWAQQWSKVQYNDEARYSPREGIIETVWQNIYEDIVSDAVSMEKLAIAEGNKVSQGVALVMQVYGLQLATDLYGDVPNTEAIRADEGIFKPSYDKQEVVYDTILARLDRADALLSSGVGSLNESFDLVYNGGTSNWRRFANSLKFRALMRISGKKNVSSDLQALMSKPMISSISNEAKLTYLSSQPNANPIYENIIYDGRTEWKVSDVLVNMMSTLNDPRLEVYAQENTDGVYRGKPAGILDVPNDDWNYNNVSAIGEFYLEPTLPGYLLSYAELSFLMAEARQKGYITTGTAEEYYNAGITASMEFNEVDDYASYLAQSTVKLSTGDELKKIAEQKWLALFSQGVEAWTEWRRTGYPELSIAIDAEESAIPTRYTYPTIEQSINKDSYKSAVAGITGGDKLTSKVWWMD